MIVGVNKEGRLTVYKRYLIGITSQPISTYYGIVTIDNMPKECIEKGIMETVDNWDKDYQLYYFTEGKEVEELILKKTSEDIKILEKGDSYPIRIDGWEEELKPLSWIYKNYVIEELIDTKGYSVSTRQAEFLVRVRTISDIESFIHDQNEEIKKRMNNIEVMNVVKKLLNNKK